MMHKFPEELVILITYLKKLPGVGTKTAERFAFELLSWDENTLSQLSSTLKELPKKIPPCAICGCLTDLGTCQFCKNRDNRSLCILASARDAYAIEATGSFKGMYHVIEHLLSPLDGRHTNTLRLDKILKRVEENNVSEIIIAFDSTLEGDTTALYLKSALTKEGISITRLGLGLPVGSSLEYVDGGTLTRALLGRQSV